MSQHGTDITSPGTEATESEEPAARSARNLEKFEESQTQGTLDAEKARKRTLRNGRLREGLTGKALDFGSFYSRRRVMQLHEWCSSIDGLSDQKVPPSLAKTITPSVGTSPPTADSATASTARK